MKIGRFDVREEARKVWNCKNFNRKKKQCGMSLCTGVYDCRFFEEREDKEEAPKNGLNFAFPSIKTTVKR